MRVRDMQWGLGMAFDKQEWTEFLSIDEKIDNVTRMLLFQYATMLDSRGIAVCKPKVLSKSMDLPEKEVRKHFNLAKNAGWLEPVDVSGKKGYQATMPF
jgi:hypothetical protein